MTRAYATAKSESGTLLVANLQYSGIVFAAFYGVVLFGEHLPGVAWLGMATVAAAGMLAVRASSPARADSL